MSYQTRTYDDNGQPVVVLVVTGTHDVSRLANLFNSGQLVTEQMLVADTITRGLRRHLAGRDALRLLHAHGGPDLMDPVKPAEALIRRLFEAVDRAAVDVSNAAEAGVGMYREYLDDYGWDDKDEAAKQAALDCAEGTRALLEVAEDKAEVDVAVAAGQFDYTVPLDAITLEDGSTVEAGNPWRGVVLVDTSRDSRNLWRVCEYLTAEGKTAYGRDTADRVRLRPVRWSDGAGEVYATVVRPPAVPAEVAR